MKQTGYYRQFASVHRLGSRRGFTLVEILVVMAIMVMLFGMLFVPISGSIDMAAEGQKRVQMQQSLQAAMELVAKDISGAQYIWLPEYIPIENAPGDRADDTYLIDYSNITLQPPGFIRPPGEDQPVVRYGVMTRKYDIVPINGKFYCVPQPPDIDNPWMLYRMEGLMRRDLAAGRNFFGAVGDTDHDGDVDDDDEFVIGLPAARNALTPRRGADIPVTRTICLDANGYLVPPLAGGADWAEGYVDRGDLDGNGTSDIEDVFGTDGVMLLYLQDGIRFGPLRVENERLTSNDTDDDDTTTFAAKYGYWLGLPSNGSYTLADVTWDPTGTFSPLFPALINSSELRPRIIVRRDGYSGGAGEDYNASCLLDTDELDPSDAGAIQVVAGTVINNMFGISWNSAQGTVSVATAAGPMTLDFDPDTPPAEDDVWDFVASDASDSGDVVQFVLGSDVYDKSIIYTALSAPANLLDTSITVDDASQFNEGDDIRIVDSSNPTTNYDDVTIAAGGISGNTITFAPALTNSYIAGDWVRENTGNPNLHRRAYSSYWLIPALEAAIRDKMVVPDSVRVRVSASGTSGTASKEYRRVTFTDPLNPKQKNIGPGQFAVQPAGTLTGGPNANDYSQAIILFGNGELGDDALHHPALTIPALLVALLLAGTSITAN